MFQPVSTQFRPTQIEEDILRFWKREHIFQKANDLRVGQPEFVFYEGPPTANGKPGVHHVLARAFKDLIPRYKTMRGFHVLRRGGWDTHGLPVEIEVEKRLGFTNKNQIEEYGIARFNEQCRQSTFEYIQDWEKLTNRIAFWVDLRDAYVTFTNDYIESVWWILHQLWEKDLLYQGYKVVPYCPRCGTPLSDHEVAQGYRETIETAIYVRLPLIDDARTSLLIWTTTPWTLPGNVAVAVHPDEEYALVECKLPDGSSERLILARTRVADILHGQDFSLIETFKGRKLHGKRYHPLFTFMLPERPAYWVELADFVTTDEGSGLVHIAPAYGAEDMQLAVSSNLPVLEPVAEDGTFIPEVRPWSGIFVKQADPLITQDLQTRGLLLSSETIQHTYPFCWRCDTPLLYYARNTWYLRTTQFKQQLNELNQSINWVPAHIRDGRFGNWLENNVDWALGRERYWGTPLPVWECNQCHNQMCISSIAELSELTGADQSSLDLHRPFVDDIHFPCPQCGDEMVRVPEIVDVWFDSGAMPVAQWHYPFENEAMFKQQFPADFVCEAVDQTRGWFYSLHAISTMLFEHACYRNVICLGLVLDGEGRKMSKSRGNIIDPARVIKIHGADALRWYLYTASPPGQERRFSIELVGEVVRSFSRTLWNVYAFFITYANLDGWAPVWDKGQLADKEPAYSDLDNWLRSSLHSLIQQVTEAYEHYDVPGATRPIQKFVDQLSKWYLRRSRRRFWKSESDADKLAAYTTLYKALVTISKLIAPAMPFIAEALYQNLVRAIDPTVPESVHLAKWPRADEGAIQAHLNEEMKLVMKLASLGHAARNQAGIKVRQPLDEISFAVRSRQEQMTLERHASLLADELNVKKVQMLSTANKALTYSLNPLPRQLGRKYRHLYPQIRQAILDLDTAGSVQALLGGHPLYVNVEGNLYKIQPDEVEIRTRGKTGLEIATDGPYMAVLNTQLTPLLISEGIAREVVRKVQNVRKQAGLAIADRIRLYIQGSLTIESAVNLHQVTIGEETLALVIATTAPPKHALVSIEHIGDEQITLGIIKALDQT